MDIDRIDRQILSVVQKDGRITNTALADRVNLSPTPCSRRLRKLERDGVIKRYVAVIDQTAFGLEVMALTFVKLDRNTVDNAERFENGIHDIPHVMECSTVTGAYDYVLRIVTENLRQYEKILKESIAAMPMVSDIESMIVLNQVMQRSQLPL